MLQCLQSLEPKLSSASWIIFSEWRGKSVATFPASSRARLWILIAEKMHRYKLVIKTQSLTKKNFAWTSNEQKWKSNPTSISRERRISPKIISKFSLTVRFFLAPNELFHFPSGNNGTPLEAFGGGVRNFGGAIIGNTEKAGGDPSILISRKLRPGKRAGIYTPSGRMERWSRAGNSRVWVAWTYM